MSNQTAALTEEAEPPKREHQLPPLLDSISWSHIRSHFCHLLFIIKSCRHQISYSKGKQQALLVKPLYIEFILCETFLLAWLHFSVFLCMPSAFLCIFQFFSVFPLHFSVQFTKKWKKQKATSSVGLPLGGLLSVLPLYFFQYFSVNQPHLSA